MHFHSALAPDLRQTNYTRSRPQAHEPQAHEPQAEDYHRNNKYISIKSAAKFSASVDLQPSL